MPYLINSFAIIVRKKFNQRLKKPKTNLNNI